MGAVSSLAQTATRATAPVALMAMIFWLSAQPDLDSGLAVDFVLRKLAHVLAFGLLTVLWWWALRPKIPNPLPAAVAISLVYAVADEYHQSFVEGRTGSVVDVGVDLIGIVAASFLLRYDRRVRSVLERDGGSPERHVAVSGDRRPADGPSRGTRGARGPVRGRGDQQRQGRGSAPD